LPNIQDPFGIPGIRERHHGVIGKTDKDTSPLEVWFHLILEPLIQHMMQENIREAGRNHPALRRAFGRMAQKPIF
jgi:hypothetical protein